jgi:transposase
LNKLIGFECKNRVTIKYESPNSYYLLISVIVSKKKRSNDRENVIALDSVVRTFQTGFTTKGHFVEYGEQDIGKLLVLGRKWARFSPKLISVRKSVILQSKK